MAERLDLLQKLQAIRALVEVDTSGCDIESVVEHGQKLAAMVGLSAETMSEAKKQIDTRLLQAIKQNEGKGYTASVLLKVAQAECSIEAATYDYADRLNAGISHQLDFYRTVISKYKAELENSMKG
jgi:hypothetical protein